MMKALARLGGLLSGSVRRRRRQGKSKRRRLAELCPTLEVRVLEERRVFHAGALVAPTAPAPEQTPPPPAEVTYVTLDAAQNLLVQDASVTGQNDQISIRFDGATGVYEISDPTHVLSSNIEGSTGSGSHTVFIPVAAISGDSIIVSAGGGDDAVVVDVSGNLGGKSLVVDGGAGQDSVTLTGGAYGTVNYQVEIDQTHIQLGSGSSLLGIDLIGVEPVYDQLTAMNRQISLGSGVGGASLMGLDSAQGDLIQLSTPQGSSFTFASPLESLSLTGSSQADVEISGIIKLESSDLTVRAGSIEVSGNITAMGSRIDLSAESSLTVTASGALKNAGGQVYLNAGESGTLKFYGRIDVSDTEMGARGGEARLLGYQVEMLDGSWINASGYSGGGAVLVGGDYQGLNPDVPRATNTLVSAGASIQANALVDGDGGKIIVWADHSAIVAGSGNLQARGGAQGGNGGLIETSGKRYLYVDAAPDASAAHGDAGLWLLDPYNVTIVNNGTGTIDTNGMFTSDATTTTIDADTIANALLTQNVTIKTGTGGTDAGNIVVQEAITVNLALLTRTLTLDAHNDIQISAAINCTTGILNVELIAAGGSVLVGANVTTNGGNFVSSGADFSNSSGVISTGGGNIDINHTGTVTIAANMNAGLTGDATIDGSSIGFGNATLSANDVTLTASGAITGGTATNDISVSGLGPSITLDGASVGTSANLMALSAGSGDVTLTADSGGIFAHFAAAFSASQLAINAAGDGQTIQLACSTGAITIDDVTDFDPNTANDQFIVETAGAGFNISFTGATLVGSSVRLAASGDITTNSTTNAIANTSGSNGTITLIGEDLGSSTNPLLVNPGTGTLALTAVGGDIYVRKSSGDLLTSKITTLSASGNNQVISLSAAGNVVVDQVSPQFNANTANDDFVLTSIGGNITLSSATALIADSATLTAASGSILATVSGTQIDTSASDGLIHLEAQSIGDSGQAVVVDPDTGDVEAVATTGGVFVAFEGSFSTGQLTDLDVAGAGQQIVLISVGGSISVNDVGGFDDTTNDDHFSLLAPTGGVTFSGGTTLDGASVTIDVQTTITRSGGAMNDIDTSASGGNITLIADGGIGTSGSRLRVRANTGDVSATTVTGSVFLSGSNIDLGAVQTGAGQQTVSIATTGNVNVVGSSVTDDDWKLDIDGDLTFVLTGSIQGGTFSTVDVDGAVVSGDAAADFVQVGAVGTLVIDAGSLGTLSDPILVDANAAATFDLNTNPGDLNFVLVSGDLTASRFVGNKVDVSSGGSIFLGTLDGSINLGATSFLSNAPTNGDLRLEAHGATGNIDFNASTLTFNEVTLIADGNIISGTATNDISVSGSGASISLTGANIGVGGSPVALSAGTHPVSLTATSGGILVQFAAAVSTSQLTISSVGNGQTIELSTTSGSFTFDSVGGFNTNTQDDNFSIVTTGTNVDIDFTGGTTLVANSVSLNASGDITTNSSNPIADTSAAGGLITLIADNLGTSGDPLRVNPGTGNLALRANGGDIYVGLSAGILMTSKITTLYASKVGATISLGPAAGGITVDQVLQFDPNTVDDNFFLTASGGDITLSSATPLTANKVTLTATSGNIVATTAATQISTSAAGVAIHLEAQAIGGATQAVVINPGAANVEAIATIGDVFLTFAGAFSTGQLSTLSVGGDARQIVLGAATGSITVGSVAGFNANTNNDHLTLKAAAGGVAFTSGTLDGASVTINAQTTITRSGAAANDIDTTSTDGIITLIAGGDIGAELSRLRVAADAGIVRATTQTGSIWLQAPSIQLGQMQTGAGLQMVSVATTGDLNVVESSTTDDDWQLNVGNNLTFINDKFIQAATFSMVQVTGDLVSGNANADFIQVGPVGTLAINAGSMGTLSNPIRVAADPAATFNLNTNTGDLNFVLVDGDLTASRFVGNKVDVQTSGATIFLSVLNGDIDLGSPSFLSNAPTSAKLRLEAHGTDGNITIGDMPLVFAEVTLIADGSIQSSLLGPSIDTHLANGNITLQSGGPIGVSPAQPLIIEAGNGQVSATTTGPTGNIYLRSTNNLLLGTIDALDPGSQVISIDIVGGPMQIGAVWDTEDIILLSAQGNITFLPTGHITAASVSLLSIGGNILGSTSVTPDIVTTDISEPIVLTAQSIGTSLIPFEINPAGPVEIKASGDVHVDVTAGDFALSRFNVLDIAGAHTFDFGVLNGDLLLDASFFSIEDDNLEFSASGDIAVAPGSVLVGAAINLQADGSIVGGNFFDLVALVGSIELSGDDGIGTAGSPLSVLTISPTGFVRATTDTGDIALRSPDLLRLDRVTTGAGTSNTVSIQADGGIQIVASSTTNDDWTLSAAGGLHFAGASTVTADSFTANVSGAISSDDPTVDVDTSAAGGNISLNGSALGQSVSHLVLQPGGGDLSLVAQAGDVWVDIAGAVLPSSQVTNLSAGGVGRNVSLTTLAGSLLLGDMTGFNVGDDFVQLKSIGATSNIDFTGSGGPLVAAQVTLDAGGSILSSGGAAVDIDTSAFNSPLSLTAGVAIGSQASPLIVAAGFGGVSATAGTGDIYVQSPGLLFVTNAVATAANRQISFTTTGTLSPLIVSVASLGSDGDNWHLIATGDISLGVFDPAGIRLSQIAELRATSPGQDVTLYASNGPIIVDSLAAGVVTADDQLALFAGGGSISSTAGQILHAATLTLIAPSGQIGSAGTAIEFATPRLISYSGGAQWLDAMGTTRILLAQTIQPSQDINLTDGRFLLDSPSSAPAVETIGGTLVVDPGVILGGSGAANANLHVRNGATIDMGFSDTGAGSLRVSGNATLDGGATLIVDINSPYVMPGIDYDQFTVGGNLFLNNATLILNGAADLSTTINPILLVELTDPGATRFGEFNPNAGSLFIDSGGVLRASVGLFRGRFLYNAGDGNDIGLSQISFVPPIIPAGPRLQPPRIPVFTRSDARPPLVQPPPQLTATVIAPLVEPDVTPVGLRYIEIRIVIPIDEAGNVREDFAFKLPAEWLADLPAVLRRLPDDHYRIYLMLEGGNEERLVMDVFVRDGRPVEPVDTMQESTEAIPDVPLHREEGGGSPAVVPEPHSTPQPGPVEGTAAPAAAPEALPVRVPVLLPSRASSRLLIGGSAAAAALIATRGRAGRWTEEVDEAAEAIGQTPRLPGWRWWRLASNQLEPAK